MTASTGTGLRRTTGALFVASALAFAVSATVLSSTFDWPDILRQPAAVVLPAFVAGGTSLVWTWFATAWTYGLLVVPILLLPAALDRRHDLALRVATYAGAVSVVLAVVVAFAGNFVINLLAFWLVEIRGITLLWMITGGLLCGLYLPVPWFPDWLRTIANWSPFPSMLQNPIDILAGRVVGADIASAVAVQVFWAVVLLGLGQVVLHAGRRRLEVQGG